MFLIFSKEQVWEDDAETPGIEVMLLVGASKPGQSS